MAPSPEIHPQILFKNWLRFCNPENEQMKSRATVPMNMYSVLYAETETVGIEF